MTGPKLMTVEPARRVPIPSAFGRRTLEVILQVNPESLQGDLTLGDNKVATECVDLIETFIFS